MKNSFKTLTQIKNLTGIVLVVLGLLCNKWIFQKFFSIYAVMELSKRVPIWLVAVSFITGGICLLLITINEKNIKNFSKGYGEVALVLFNTFLLFVFVNVVIFAYFTVREVFLYKNQIFLKYGISLNKVYPDLNEKDINQLLRETWSRPCIYEPFTQFKERPYKGIFVNVSENGFRIHEDQGPWPPDSINYNIFLFGGSTVFNYGVPDNFTIASYLQRLFLKDKIQKRVCVYNFGRGYYFSSQERILFEKLLISGFTPDAAVFIDGLNDFYYVKDEPLFTSRLRYYLDKGGSFLFKVPIVQLIYEIKNSSKHEKHILQMSEDEFNNAEIIESVIKRYLENRKIIETLANLYKVKSVFVWQPVPTYEYDLSLHSFAKHGFGGFTYSKFGYKRMSEVIKNQNPGNNFLWLADIQKSAIKPLYVDIDHYSAEFSEIIAGKIHDFLLDKNIVK